MIFVLVEFCEVIDVFDCVIDLQTRDFSAHFSAGVTHRPSVAVFSTDATHHFIVTASTK